MNLARWIRRQPVPHALMCDATRILIGDGHRRWADAIDAVFGTTSTVISAVAKDGTVLRVCQRADIDDAPAEPTPEDTTVTDQQRSLAQIAQILADAYSTAHDHARENSARGYELLAKFAELSFGRLAAIERAYGQLLAAHARAIEDQPSDDGLNSAMAGLLSKTMGANGAAAAKKEPST